VQEGGDRIAATITAHHLRYNRDALFVGPDGRNGIRPHLYCLPVLKRERHRQALLQAATGGSGKFFLGTDSAPHPVRDKESACGCAGCFTAPAALSMYADCFEQAGALDRLEAFASFHGADFYRLPRNRDTIKLERTPWQLPSDLPFGGDRVVPLGAGETFPWRLAT
jgi:dihydroorotase